MSEAHKALGSSSSQSQRTAAAAAARHAMARDRPPRRLRGRLGRGGSKLHVVSAADASAIGGPIEGDSEAITGIPLTLSPAGHRTCILSLKVKWDMEKRSCFGTRKGHLGAIGCVAFSKKSKNFYVSQLVAAARIPPIRLPY